VGQEAKPVIRNYNKLAKALLQFEMVWHQGWCEAVIEAKVRAHVLPPVPHAC
jgi:dynein heavy chain